MVHNQVVIHHQARLNRLLDMDHHQINKVTHLLMLHSRISHQVVNNSNQGNMVVLVHNQIINSHRPKRHLKMRMLQDNPEIILHLLHKHTRIMSYRKIIHHLQQLVRLNLLNLDLSKMRVHSLIMLANQVLVLAQHNMVLHLHLHHLVLPLQVEAILMLKAISRQVHHLPQRKRIHQVVVNHQHHRELMLLRYRLLLDILFIKHLTQHRTHHIHHRRIHHHHINHLINHHILRISHLINHLTNLLINHPRTNHHINHRNNLSNSRKQLRRRNNNHLRIRLRAGFSHHPAHHKVPLHRQVLNNSLLMDPLLRKHMFPLHQVDNHRYLISIHS